MADARAPAGTPHVVQFDGACGLCSRLVRFIVARDRGGRFRFVPRPSEADALVLLADGRAYTGSDAVLEIAARLDGPWRALRWLRILPKRLREPAYGFVAARRYRWFGRAEACPIPAPFDPGQGPDPGPR